MTAFPAGVSQRTWSTTVSEPVTATFLRQNVTDPVWLLTSPPMAVLQQTVAATSIPTATVTAIGMDTETLDSTNGHQDTSNPSRWYAAVPGWYLVRGAVAYTANSGAQLYSFTASYRVVNSGVTTSVDMNIGCSQSSLLVLMAGSDLCVLNTPSATVTSNDYIYLYGFQNTGATQTTNIATPDASYLMTRWAGTVTGTAGLPVPANPSYSDTTEITGAFLNASMRDAVNYLTFPPMARLTPTSAQSVPSQTFPAGTAITFGQATAPGTSSSSDNYSGWSSSVNPARYTFQRAGRYYVYGQVAFTGTNGASWGAGVRVNGGTTQWGSRTGAGTTSSAAQVPNIETRLRVSAGDYAELLGYQNSGSAVNTSTGTTSSKLIVLWEGS